MVRLSFSPTPAEQKRPHTVQKAFMRWGEQPQKTACGSAYPILTECGCDLLLLSKLLSGVSLLEASNERAGLQAHRTKLSLRTSINTYHERNPFSILHVINSRVKN